MNPSTLLKIWVSSPYFTACHAHLNPGEVERVANSRLRRLLEERLALSWEGLSVYHQTQSYKGSFDRFLSWMTRLGPSSPLEKTPYIGEKDNEWTEACRFASTVLVTLLANNVRATPVQSTWKISNKPTNLRARILPFEALLPTGAGLELRALAITSDEFFAVPRELYRVYSAFVPEAYTRLRATRLTARDVNASSGGVVYLSKRWWQMPSRLRDGIGRLMFRVLSGTLPKLRSSGLPSALRKIGVVLVSVLPRSISGALRNYNLSGKHFFYAKKIDRVTKILA